MIGGICRLLLDLVEEYMYEDLCCQCVSWFLDLFFLSFHFFSIFSVSYLCCSTMHGRSIVHVIYSEFFHLIQSRIKFAALLLIRIGSIRTFKFVNGYST